MNGRRMRRRGMDTGINGGIDHAWTSSGEWTSGGSRGAGDDEAANMTAAGAAVNGQAVAQGDQQAAVNWRA